MSGGSPNGGGYRRPSVPLDERRRNAALGRVKTAVTAAEYHEKQAAAEREKARLLVRTWDLCAASERIQNDPAFVCCGDPGKCQRPDLDTEATTP